MKKLLLFTLVIGFFLLGSCKNADYSIEKEQISNDCLVAPIAYPILTPIPDEVGSAVYMNPEQTAIAPSSNWESVTTVENHSSDFTVVDNNVWFASNPIQKYSLENNSWDSYPEINGHKGYPLNWFVSRDGVLWGYDIVWENNQSGQILIRYNEEKDTFEIFENQNSSLKLLDITSNIVEDQQGNLWMFVQEIDEVALYSVNPQKLEMEKHHSFVNGGDYSSVAVQANGNLWFIDVFGGYLSYYIPSINEIHTYEGYPSVNDLEKMGSIYNLYFDDINRLWIDNSGWLDLNKPDEPIWYSILEVPEFSTNNLLPSYYSGYINVPANEIFQSSNGNYWFSSQIGIVKLDFEQQEWCHITTGLSSVVEDDQHNLWILVNGTLYKRNIY